MSADPPTSPPPPSSPAPNAQLSMFRVAFVAAPFVIGIVLFAAMGALMLATRDVATAGGARAEIRFQAECAEQFAALSRARAETIGLGELEVTSGPGEVTIRAVLPGLEDDLTAVPRLLTAPAKFAVYAATSIQDSPQGEPLATGDDVTDTWFQLDVTGHPYTAVELQPHALKRVEEAKAGVMLYVLDGQVIATYESSQTFKGETLELHPLRETTREEVRQATDWHILLNHGPAPCEATALVVTPLP